MPLRLYLAVSYHGGRETCESEQKLTRRRRTRKRHLNKTTTTKTANDLSLLQFQSLVTIVPTNYAALNSRQ